MVNGKRYKGNEVLGAAWDHMEVRQVALYTTTWKPNLNEWKDFEKLVLLRNGVYIKQLMP